jgi:hypothetical protein
MEVEKVATMMTSQDSENEPENFGQLLDSLMAKANSDQVR